MNDETDFKQMENLFLALADKTRLRLLNLMREGEICVCFFTEVLGESQPKISRHLSYLRSAGIVSARRDGKWIHYRIEHPENKFVTQILRDTLQWLASQTQMLNDYERLSVIINSPNTPATITRAPKPNVYVKTNVSENKPSEKFAKNEIETFLL